MIGQHLEDSQTFVLMLSRQTMLHRLFGKHRIRFQTSESMWQWAARGFKVWGGLAHVLGFVVHELAADGTENQVDMPFHQFRKGGLGAVSDVIPDQVGVVHVQGEVPARRKK